MGTDQIKQRPWFGTLLYLTQRGPVHTKAGSRREELGGRLPDKKRPQRTVSWGRKGRTFVLDVCRVGRSRHAQIIRKPKGRSLSQWLLWFYCFLDEGPCPRPPNFRTLKLAASA